MSLQYIFGENEHKWFAVDIEDGNTILNYTYKFDDYPGRPWWHKGIFYGFDLIYRETPEKLHVVMISYWDVKGHVMSCPDCAMTKLWYVIGLDESDPEITWNEQTFFHNIFSVCENILPKIVIQSFRDQIIKLRGFDPIIIDEIKQKAIKI